MHKENPSLENLIAAVHHVNAAANSDSMPVLWNYGMEKLYISLYALCGRDSDKRNGIGELWICSSHIRKQEIIRICQFMCISDTITSNYGGIAYG